MAEIGEFLGPIQEDAVNIPGKPEGNISVRENNPYNLVYAGQPGAKPGSLIGGSPGAAFETPEAGWEAGVRQIEKDKTRPLTLAQFGDKYFRNPKTTQDEVNAYVKDLTKLTGFSADTPISKIPTDALSKAVAKKESGATKGEGGILAKVGELLGPASAEAAEPKAATPGEFLGPLPGASVSGMISPVTGELGGGFGDTRPHGPHHAGDIYAGAGTPVVAPGDVRVIAPFPGRGMDKNNMKVGDWGVELQDINTGQIYNMVHMADTSNLKQGQTFKAGEQVGTIGNVVSKPHLHLAVKDKEGNPIDWMAQIGAERGTKFSQAVTMAGKVAAAESGGGEYLGPIPETKEGSVWTGLKEGYVNFVGQMARSTAMMPDLVKGAGIVSKAPSLEAAQAEMDAFTNSHPAYNAFSPADRRRVTEEATKNIIQEFWPGGVPPEDTSTWGGFASSLVRNAVSMWPVYLQASLLAPALYAPVAEALGGGALGHALGGAGLLGALGLTAEDPYKEVPLMALMGAAGGPLKVYTATMPFLTRWLSRMAGGAAIFGGTTALGGGTADEIKKNAALGAFLEVFNIGGKAKEDAMRNMSEEVKTQLQEIAENVQRVKEEQGIVDLTRGATAELLKKAPEGSERMEDVTKLAGLEREAEIRKQFAPEVDEAVLRQAALKRQLEINSATTEWRQKEQRFETPGEQAYRLRKEAKEYGVKEWERKLASLRDRYEADKIAARKAGQPEPPVPPEPVEIRKEADEILERMRAGKDHPILEFIEPEQLERLRQGQLPSPELEERIHNALVGERGVVTPEWEKIARDEGVQKMYGGGPETTGWFNKVWENLKAAPPVGRPSESRLSNLKKMYKATQSFLAPETVGPIGMETAQQLVKHFNEAKRQADIAGRNLQNYRLKFAELGYDPGWKLSAKMERNEKVPTEFQGYAKARQEAFDQTHKLIDKIREGDIGYIKHYAPGLHADPHKAMEFYRNWMGTIGGRKGFLEKRIYPDMDVRRAHGLEPLFDNPAQQDMAGLMEQWKYVGAARFLDGLEKDGLFLQEKEGKTARAVPDGWEKTPMNFFRQGWAPKEAMDVIRNHFTGGQDNLAYRKYGNMMAMWNAFHVSLSAFHAMTTTSHSFAMGTARAIPEFLGAVLTSDNARAARALKMITEMSPFNVWKMSKIGEETYYEPGKHGPGWDKIVDMSVAGGASPRDMAILGGFAADSFKELLWQMKRGEIGNSFRSMMHLAGKPVMGQVVRRLKWGSTLVRNKIELEKLQEHYEKKYGKPQNWSPKVQGDFAKDSGNIAYNEREFSDKIFGQIDPDNIHWNRAFSRWLKGIIAYPSWNKGTFGWMAGMVRGAAKLAMGKPLDYQAKLSLEFGLGLLVTQSLANTIMHMALNNGQAPEDWKDVLIGARTGRYLSNGAPERVNIASYMKDIMGTVPTPQDPTRPFKAALSKLQAPFQMFGELRDNADFFGTEIIPSRGTPADKALGLGRWFGSKVAPFGMSNIFTGKSPITQYGGMLGFRPVPRYISSSEAMNRVDEILQAQSPKRRTQEESATSRTVAELRDLGWAGRTDEMEAGIDKAQEEGKITALQAKHIRETVGKDMRVAQFDKLRKLEDAMEVYDLGSPEERALWQDRLMAKWMRATPDKREGHEEEFERLMELPTASEMPERIPPEPTEPEPTRKEFGKRFSILD